MVKSRMLFAQCIPVVSMQTFYQTIFLVLIKETPKRIHILLYIRIDGKHKNVFLYFTVCICPVIHNLRKHSTAQNIIKKKVMNFLQC